MKKVLSVLMVVAILVSMLAINTVSAAADPYFEVSEVSGNIGEQVTVTVSLKNSPGFGGIAYDVCYDNANLKLISYELDLGKGICTESEMDRYPDKMNFQYAGTSNVEGDGVLVSFVFEIIGSKPGTAEIKVVPEEGTSFYYDGRKEIDFTIETATGAVTMTCEHVNKTEVPAKSADCLQAGNNKYYTCDACGAVLRADGVTETTVEKETIAALGHDYVEVVTPADCTNGGYTTYTCSRCADSYKDNETDALGHNYVAKTVEPTCTEKGYTVHTCSRCADSYKDNEVDALGHSFVDYKSNNDATCTEDGTKTAKCERCDVTATVADVGSALGHDMADATCTEPATCRREGCGYTEGKPLGHKLATEWSMGETGHWYECTVCHEKSNFNEHDFGSEGDTCGICGYVRDHVHRLTVVPAIEVTCTTDGRKAYYTCSGCDDWFADVTGSVIIEDHASVIVKALGHDYVAVVKPATCTEGGYTTHTCSHCGDSYVDGKTEALGHNYVEKTVEPTCTEKGYTANVCSRCGDIIDKKEIDALGHDYVATVTAPTCAEKGYTTHTCSRCDDSYVDTYVDVLEHTLETEWSKGDENGHWHTCEVCGGHDTPVAHVPGAEATTEAPQVCTVCGYVIKEALPEETDKPQRVDVTEGLKEVPKEIAEKFATVEAVKEALVKAAVNADKNVSKDTAKSVLLDVELKVKEADGLWTTVTPENFPAEGVKVLLPYPDGTNKDKYTFVVTHMITSGAKAGEIEVLQGTLEKDGISVTFTSMSPVVITYQEKTTDNAGGNKPADPSTPQTGDTSYIMVWIAVLLVSAVVIGILVFCSKKKHYHGKYVK